MSVNLMYKLDPKWINQRSRMNPGDLLAVQINWYPVFALVPHKTIRGKWYWLKTIYKRRVWRYTGISDEPFTEYGDIFDMLKEND